MLNIEFLTWFVVINFIFMSFSHVMISYVYSGYSAFKKMYPGTEDEYKKLKRTILGFEAPRRSMHWYEWYAFTSDILYDYEP